LAMDVRETAPPVILREAENLLFVQKTTANA